MSTKKRPHILVTNDDGIHAPGIRHLWNALAEFADVTVVAPVDEQSATSLSITIRTPLRLTKVDWPEHPTSKSSAWSVSGTPADCVKLGLNVVMDSPPDLIVSGINRGNNSGRNVLYSGTIAGVIEGVLHDIPGIAFSCSDYFDPTFDAAEPFIKPVVNHVLENPLPNGTFLNVNFPENVHKGIKGFKFARQGKEYWAENPDKRQDPTEKNHYYWLGLRLAEYEEHPESDVAYLKEGYMTAVPINISELTHHKLIEQRKEHFEKIFDNLLTAKS